VKDVLLVMDFDHFFDQDPIGPSWSVHKALWVCY
jgi:hypothetical protein